MLKDEIATSLLDIEPVTSTTLNFVMKHVSDSGNRTSCLLEVIGLNFVYGSSQSYEKFVQVCQLNKTYMGVRVQLLGVFQNRNT